MKIRHSIYELISKRPIQSKKMHTVRQGALLQVEFEDGTVGYADCHPWEEFGDQPIQTQLNLLKSGRCTRLTARSIYFAKADAKAREKKMNLLNTAKIPTNHYFISQLDETAWEEIKIGIENGFKYFKFKLRSDQSQEEEILREIVKHYPQIKLRLDFNSKLSHEQFISFLDRMSAILPCIDFIEDPTKFDYTSWRQVQDVFKLNLAADEHYKIAYGHPEAAKVLIMKPAVHTLKPIDIGQKVIVTSYLDHPIGQICAAYMASKVNEDTPNVEPCGLLSHFAYESNPFSEMLKQQGPDLQSVDGYGWGFDELLKKQEFVG